MSILFVEIQQTKVISLTKQGNREFQSQPVGIMFLSFSWRLSWHYGIHRAKSTSIDSAQTSTPFQTLYLCSSL